MSGNVLSELFKLITVLALEIKNSNRVWSFLFTTPSLKPLFVTCDGVFLNLNFFWEEEAPAKRTNDLRETLFLSFFQMDVLDRRGTNYQD